MKKPLKRRLVNRYGSVILMALFLNHITLLESSTTMDAETIRKVFGDKGRKMIWKLD